MFQKQKVRSLTMSFKVPARNQILEKSGPQTNLDNVALLRTIKKEYNLNNQMNSLTSKKLVRFSDITPIKNVYTKQTSDIMSANRTLEKLRRPNDGIQNDEKDRLKPTQQKKLTSHGNTPSLLSRKHFTEIIHTSSMYQGKDRQNKGNTSLNLKKSTLETYDSTPERSDPHRSIYQLKYQQVDSKYPFVNPFELYEAPLYLQRYEKFEQRQFKIKLIKIECDNQDQAPQIKNIQPKSYYPDPPRLLTKSNIRHKRSKTNNQC